MATDTRDPGRPPPTPAGSPPTPSPGRGVGWGGAAPEGLALDADALGQATEEGRRALLDHMLHPQAPLDVLQQAAQETQEVLRRADGAGHRLCREMGSARCQRGRGVGRGGGKGGRGGGTAHPLALRQAARGWPGGHRSPGQRWPPAAPPPGGGTPLAVAARRSP